MISSTLIRRLAASGALVAALSLAGGAMAANPPASTHASDVAVGAVGTGAAIDSLVVAAAQSDTVGGAHQNHGGYVSCVARGGSNCTSTTPTLPSHGDAGTPDKPEGSGKD